MRSCIYCGRDLAEGEKCTCKLSEAHRNNTVENDKTSDSGVTSDNNTVNEKTSEKNTDTKKKKHHGSNNEDKYSSPDYNNANRTEYRAGYTKHENKFKAAFEKAKAKKNAERASGFYFGQFGKGFFSDLLIALRYPVRTVRNPKRMSMWQMVFLWAIQGALAWLCLFFIVTHAARGPFAMLGNMLAFNGVQGYKVLLYMLLSIFSGGVAGIIAFYVYTGVFYGINRFIMRDRSTMYSSFCERLAPTALPFSAIALIGTILSPISVTTLIIMLVCGGAAFAVLTYEALKAQWSWAPADKTLINFMLGFFVIAIVVGYIIRLS